MEEADEDKKLASRATAKSISLSAAFNDDSKKALQLRTGSTH